MSTTSDEIKIDLDEVDAKAAAEAAKKGKSGTVDAEAPLIKVDEAAKGDDKVAITPDAGLEKLKKQLEGEKAARLAADQRAQEAENAELRARSETQTTQLDLVKNAIASVTQANDALEGKYADALAAQDFAAAAKINREMGANSAKLLQLENGKAALERAPKPSPRAQVDKVEEYIGRIPSEYPRSRTWLREHPDFVRDEKKNQQMIAAHQLAIARGLTADTDAYFASIEKTLDIESPAHVDPPKDGDEDPTKDAARPAPRKAPPAAAPVTRSGNGAGARPNVVTLSAAEVEVAQMNGLTPEEYAKNKMALIKDKRMN